MTEAIKDFYFWKNGKGRYAPGGKYHKATRPMEGGTTAPGYVPKAGYVTRPQAVAIMNQNREAPEPMEADTMPYAPPQMQADPFDKSAKAKKAGALETEMPEPIIQDAEAPEDVYTSICLFKEGEPAPVR